MKTQKKLIIRTLLIPTSLMMFFSSVAIAIEPASLPPTGPMGVEKCNRADDLSLSSHCDKLREMGWNKNDL